MVPYLLPSGPSCILEGHYGRCSIRRKSVHLLTCKGCEQRTSTPHTLAPPDSGEAHLTDTFCLVHVQPNCWRPDSGAESHLSVASLLSSSFSFPVVGFLKPSRSWIHESGANLPCLAAWDGYPDIRAFSLQPLQSLRRHSCLGVGGGERQQEKTSSFTIWCSSWFIYQTEKFTLKFRYFCWIEPFMIPLARLQPQHPSLPGLVLEFTCCSPAHPNSCPCWASKEQGSQGGAGGGWGSCLPSSHKQGSDGSFCMPRMPSMECCASKRLYYSAGIKHEKLYFFKSVKLELPWCISGHVVIILIILQCLHWMFW